MLKGVRRGGTYVYLSTDEAHMMERVENVANLPSPRPVLDPPTDFATQGSPVATIIGNAAVHIVLPLEDRLCEEIRLGQPFSPRGRALVDGLDPIRVRGAEAGSIDVGGSRFEEVGVVGLAVACVDWVGT